MTPYPRLTDEPGLIATARDITSGTISAVEATKAAIARIEGLDGPLNAVVVRDFDRALTTAQALDDAGPDVSRPLHGVPMTVKESFDVAGLPTTWGMEIARGSIASNDAEIVTRLKAAGAVILGKTNIPPFLADWQAANPIYGVTNNPHNPARTPGGSSGGAAAAVASGMVAGEYGSDIGGSIRVPAHYCGIFGHKPTFDAVPLQGHDMPGSDGARPMLGVAGPLARNADDLALLFDVTTDPVWPAQAKPLRDCRFLLVDTHPEARVQSAIGEALHGLADRLRGAGATVDTHSALLPDLATQHHDYLRMLNTSLMAGAPRPDGSQPTVRDWFDLCDAQARNQRAWAALLADYDFVLAPPAGITASPHYAETGMQGRTIAINGEETVFSQQLAWAGLSNFPGLPTTAAPIASDNDGLPIGVQIIGATLRDRDCIRMAGVLEALVGA